MVTRRALLLASASYSALGPSLLVQAARADALCESGACLRRREGDLIAIRTISGNYLTAADGGGYGGPNGGPGSVALHSDARRVGPWERFHLVWLGPDERRFALQTINGTYISAINGGGMGGPNDGRCPFHTDARGRGPDEIFHVALDRDGWITLRTRKGFFVTAVNGGGFGGPNNVPVHTDASRVGPWETFSFG